MPLLLYAIDTKRYTYVQTDIKMLINIHLEFVSAVETHTNCMKIN